MTERLGAIKYGRDGADPFFGREFTQHRDYSEEIAAAIDDEVRNLIETAHHEAYDILIENRVVLDALVVALMEKETLDKAEVAKIFEPLIKRDHRKAWTGSVKRVPSELPPVVVPGKNGLNGLNQKSPDEK